MGHYPIKCIHCMREIMMDERMVKLDPEDIRAADIGLRSVNAEELDLSGIGIRKADILYKSIAELSAEGKISRVNTLPVKVSREFLEKNPKEYERDFLQSIDVKDLEINGKPMSGTVRKFYCPHCHNEIIPLAGKMPMYLVSLMGPSSAGKTVYLTILHILLNGKQYNLPTGCLFFSSIGEMAREFDRYKMNLIKNNQLPATTQELRKDPYLLKVSYRADPFSATTDKQCLLGLIDMRGEMLQGGQNDQLTDFNVPQFREADGFIMMVDPETLDTVHTQLPEELFGGRTIEALSQTISSMRETIMDCITAELGKIQKPSVVSLVKQDILYKYHEQLGIPFAQPVIAPKFGPVLGTSLGEKYYEPMKQSTKACIQYLSGSFAFFLEETFENPYFVSLSALGREVQIKGNKIDNYQKIQPVRVEEPLLWLLMAFDFVPPFYHEAYFRIPEQVVREWAKNFAEEAEDLQEAVSSKPENTRKGGGGKKRWFGK